MKREAATGPRAIGNRVHACVATYYDTAALLPLAGDRVAAALALHNQFIAADLGLAEDEFASKEILREGDLSRAMLEGYFEWLEETGEDEGFKVVGVEESIELELPTGDTVRAKLDLRIEQVQTGEQFFLDHKTVPEFTTPTKSLHMDEQMLMYHWLIEQVKGIQVSGAVYNMIRKVKRTASAKPPFFSRFVVRHSPGEVASFYTRLLGELEDMNRLRLRLDAGVDPMAAAYPSPTRNCSWDCDFYAVCPLVDRPQDGGGEGMIALIYEVGDPYARYGDDKGAVAV